MADHWILTNREVDPEAKDGNDIVEGGQADRLNGSPMFRVARFETNDLEKKPTTSDLKRRVRFLADGQIQDYRDTLDQDGTHKGSKEMFRSLFSSMKSAPEGKGDVLFFIHGFNYKWSDSLVHLQKLHRLYVEPQESPVSHIVYFSWPSWGRQLRYWSDQEIALVSGQVLGRMFAKLVQFYRDVFGSSTMGVANPDRPEFCNRRIHLAAHSMGNQVLEQFMRTFSALGNYRIPVFGETLLLNADADWTALERGEPLYSLPCYSDRIHVYNHKGDDALGVSEHTKNSERRLGKHGPRRDGKSQIADRTIIVDSTELNGARGKRAADDMTLNSSARLCKPGQADDFLRVAKSVLPGGVGFRERLFDHWGYLHRPEVVADIWQVLRGLRSSKIAGRDGTNGVLYRLTPR